MNIPLTKLVPLYRQMNQRSWSDGRLCGDLEVKDEETAILLRELLRDELADDYPCYVEEGNPYQVEVGSYFKLRFAQFRVGIGLLLENTQSLLRNTKACVGELPTNWYLVVEDEASWENGRINHRLAAIKQFITALEGEASLYDPRKFLFVFIRGDRFDVPVKFELEAFEGFDQAILEELIALLKQQDGHAKQRHEICSTAIREMLAGLPIEQRFPTLLLRLAELKQRLLDGYALFVSSFSFEKLRDQAEALRIEYTGKIHKVLADIQGQLLGIPVSALVVATQFKDVGSNPPAQLWINLGVYVGALFFCILFALSAWNQFHTLRVIEDELTRQENILRKENADIASKLSDVFQSLRMRALQQRIVLCVVSSVVLGGLVVSTCTFYNLTHTYL